MSVKFEQLTLTILLLDKVSEPAKDVCKSLENIQVTAKSGAGKIQPHQIGSLPEMPENSGKNSLSVFPEAILNLFENHALKTSRGTVENASALPGGNAPSRKPVDGKPAPAVSGLDTISQAGADGRQAIADLLVKIDRLKISIRELDTVRNAVPNETITGSMNAALEQSRTITRFLHAFFRQALLPVLDALQKGIEKISPHISKLYGTVLPLRWLFNILAVGISGAITAIRGFVAIFELIEKLRSLRKELRMIYAWCLRNSAATYSMTTAQRLNAIMQSLWQRTIGGTVIGMKLHALWLAVCSKAQIFWTAVTKKGAFAAAIQTVWTKTLALCNRNLAVSANAVTGATIKQSLAAVWAAVRYAAVTIATIAWQAATWACRAALIATKAVLLFGAIPAAVAWASTLIFVKGASLVLSGVMWLLTTGIGAAAAAAWTFTAALLANPITWIVLGVVALAGALAALVCYWDEVCNFCVKYADYLLALLGPIGWVIAAFRNWDKITAFLKNLWGAFQKMCPNIANLIEKIVAVIWAGIKAPFVWIVEKVQQLCTLFSWLGGVIAAPFRLCYEWLSDKLVPVIQLFSGLLETVQNFFSGLFSGISGFGSAIAEKVTGVFSDLDGWAGKMLRKVSKIPGFGFLAPNVSTDGAAKTLESVSKVEKAAGTDLPAIGKETPVVPDAVAVRKQTDVPAGGIRNTQTTNNNYGGISIYAPGGMNPAQLDEWLLLHGV